MLAGRQLEYTDVCGRYTGAFWRERVAMCVVWRILPEPLALPMAAESPILWIRHRVWREISLFLIP